LNAELCMN